MIDLEERAMEARSLLDRCRACPRRCGVDRNGNERGYCGIGRDAAVSSYGPHMGEEPPLTGWKGSGTIFFSGCNMRCQYCQNHDISQEVSGQTYGPDEIAMMMLSLQRMGCHNINLVSPTHVMPQIVESLSMAKERGLRVPIVYNTGGYDTREALRMLDGIVDIYMPDMKYSDPEVGMRLSDAPDYPRINRRAVKEMHRQVGDLVLDRDGIAVRGLLVRHLVLPNDLAGSEATLRFISEGISPNTYVNIMDQYRPCHHAGSIPGIDRRITTDEYRRAVDLAREAGLKNMI